MSIKQIKKGLGLAALALGLIGGGSTAQAGFATSDIQLLYGDGIHLGRNFGVAGEGETKRAIVTVNHFSTWTYGDNFFFIDLNYDEDGTGRERDFYAEGWEHISLSKATGQDLSFGFVRDISLGAGINKGKRVTILAGGIRADLAIPTFNFVTAAIYAYDTVQDPFSRNLDTTYQATIVWDKDFNLSDKWHFKFKGFVDFIGDQGPLVDNQIVFQPQLLLDVGNFWGKPGKVGLGVEYAYFKNKFGVTDVTDNSLQLLLEYRLH